MALKGIFESFNFRLCPSLQF